MRRRRYLKGIGVGIGTLVASEPSETVSVDGLSVRIVETNDPVTAGDFLDVTSEIENAGRSDVRPEIEFFVGDERRISKITTIGAGETDTVDFNHRTYPVREDVEFPVAVESGDDRDERTVDVLGIDELDDGNRRPDSDVTIQPGTTVLFEVDSNALGEYGGGTHWYLEDEYSGWSHGPWNWAYYDDQGADHWLRSFESEGTYRVVAAVRGDEENYTARWTVSVTSDGLGTPAVENVSPPAGPLELSSTEAAELTATVTDPAGALDRVVWWLGHADLVLGVSDVEGAEDTASLSTDDLCHGCPIILWVSTENGTVIEEHVWTAQITHDGRTRVTIQETTDPVEAGSVLGVIAEVENTGSSEITEDLELVVGNEQVDTASVTVGPTETEAVSLAYETYPVQVDVEFPVMVRSTDDRDTRTVEVLADVGPTAIRILETNDPVAAGEILEVGAEVTNTEPATITEDVHLVAGDRVATETITLGAGETERISLAYETYPVQVDVEFPVEVRGDGSRDSRPVQVFADGVPPFAVTILETNDPVDAGEFLEVTAEIENTGDTAVTQDVDLVVGGESVATDSVTLDRDETTELDLGYETYPVRRNVTFPVRVESGGVSDEHIVDVFGTDDTGLAVTSIETNAPIDPGGVLEVTAGIENVGDTADSQSVVLSIDGVEVASDDLSLEPGSTSEITLSYATDEDDAGTRTVSIRTPDDEERTEVTIGTGESVTPSLEVVDYNILGGESGEEYVTIRNTGDDTLDASGWSMEDDGLVPANSLSPFEFPSGFTLEPGADVTIVTGDGENTGDTLYWGVARQVWAEDGDTVIVRDGDGEIILEEPIAAESIEEEDASEEQEDEDEDELADPATLALVDYYILGGEPNEEYITIRNTGEHVLDASGWSVEDDGLVPANSLSPFEFPSGFTLEPGADVTIVTGHGENTADTLYWGVDRQIWDEDGDTVIVRDGDGEIVLEESIAADSPDPTADLTVADQEGDGEILLVDAATADEDFVLEARYTGEIARSAVLDAEATVENFELGLEPPLEVDATVEVSVLEATTDEELTTETVQYVIAEEPDEEAPEESGEEEPPAEESPEEEPAGEEPPEEEPDEEVPPEEEPDEEPPEQEPPEEEPVEEEPPEQEPPDESAEEEPPQEESPAEEPPEEEPPNEEPPAEDPPDEPAEEAPPEEEPPAEEPVEEEPPAEEPAEEEPVEEEPSAEEP